MNCGLRLSIALCILFLVLVTDSYGMDNVQWGRNPFLTRDEIASLGKKDARPLSPVSTKAPTPHWELKSIIISGPEKVAIINGRIVTVGDSLGNQKVLEINPNGVILGGKGGKTVIKLKQPSLSIKTVKKPR